MVARTLPFARDKPEDLPSIAKEIERQNEADRADIKKQLRHANEQITLTRTYPGRNPTRR
jgi:hypothetical protein